MQRERYGTIRTLLFHLVILTLTFVALSLVIILDCCNTPNQVINNENEPGIISSLSDFGRIRMVWLKNGELENGGGTLIGYDSKGDNYHTIHNSTVGFTINRPLIYDNGTRVAFTNTYDRLRYGTYSMSWDGTDLRYISDGECSCVWIDPVTKENWFFIRKGGADTTQPIIRVNEKTLEQSLVWNKRSVGSVHSRVWFSVSGDGKRANCCFPWSLGDSYVLFNPVKEPNGNVWASTSRGCWYSMAPDLSYTWFHLLWNTSFNGHTSIKLFSDTTEIGDFELRSRGRTEEHFHVRFGSNTGKLIVASVRPKNLDASYYDSTEIVVGKLSDNLNGFSNWVQISHDTLPDYYPDLWANVADDAPVCKNPLQIVSKAEVPVDSKYQMVIVSPEENDTFTISDSINLEWVVKDGNAVSGWLIEYSLSNGKRWISCNTGHSFPAEWRSYSIPCSKIAQNITTFPVKVSVRVYDYFSKDIVAVRGPVYISK